MPGHPPTLPVPATFDRYMPLRLDLFMTEVCLRYTLCYTVFSPSALLIVLVSVSPDSHSYGLYQSPMLSVHKRHSRYHGQQLTLCHASSACPQAVTLIRARA